MQFGKWKRKWLKDDMYEKLDNCEKEMSLNEMHRKSALEEWFVKA